MARGLLIAGGGTGGHLFPGLAVAAACRAQEPGLELAFVNTGKALESQALSRAGYDLEPLAARAFRGAGLMGRLKSLAVLPGALLGARSILKRRRPALVLAVGGYAAFPLGVMARLGGVTLAVQEQNALPGLTNRLLGKVARQVFVSFPEAQAHFPARRSLLVGNPVRPDLLEAARQAAGQRPDPGERFRVLILGGSQGAHSLNQALCQALPLLAGQKARLHFTHQTGASDQALVQAAYAEQGFEAQVADFFEDMGRLYGLAHLVICRAGAGTLTELTACGRAGICVPYPHAAGDHQTKNAQSLVSAGAARLLPDGQLSGQAVASLLLELMDQPQVLRAMEERAQALGRPQAAQEIASRCLALIKEAH